MQSSGALWMYALRMKNVFFELRPFIWSVYVEWFDISLWMDNNHDSIPTNRKRWAIVEWFLYTWRNFMHNYQSTFQYGMTVMCLRYYVYELLRLFWEIFIDFFPSIPLEWKVLYNSRRFVCYFTCLLWYIDLYIGFSPPNAIFHFNRIQMLYFSPFTTTMYSILPIDCLFSLSHFRHNRNNIAIVSNKYARP